MSYFNVGLRMNAFMIGTFKMASKMAASLKEMLSIKVKIPTLCVFVRSVIFLNKQNSNYLHNDLMHYKFILELQ